MANIEIDMDILTATEVEPTPFRWELMPIIKNKEINNMAQ